MSGMTRPWIDPATDKRRAYYNICIIKYFLDIISPNNDFKDKLLALFAAFPEIDPWHGRSALSEGDLPCPIHQKRRFGGW